MPVNRQILPVVLIGALAAGFGVATASDDATKPTDTSNRAVRSTDAQQARQAARRAAPRKIETELAEVPAPFKREWFYFGDKPAMFNRVVTQIGDEAPDLAVDNWRGDSFSLEKAKGEIIVLDFWATWCGPCKAAFPELNALAKEYAEKGVRIVGICDDKKGAENFEQICDQHNLAFPNGIDTGDRATGEKYGRIWFPFLVIIDREGVIRAKGINPSHLQEAIDALLEEQPAES